MTITNSIRKFKKTFNVFSRTTLLHKILYFLAFLICIILMTNYGRTQVEGFEKKTNGFVMNTEVPNIYDDFYVSLYDDLVFFKHKNDYEIKNLIKNTKLTQGNSNVLDIGSGTGHHVSSLKAHGFDATGIDISPSMIKKAKETYPELNFQLADALNGSVFNTNTFTHITCFYFTIYYMKDKHKFFENCMTWLSPGGYLAIHLVNRDKFDPIIPAGNPFTIVSPQKYADKRITTTTIKFDNYEYKSNFDMKQEVKSLDEPNVLMVETFKNMKNGDVKKNEHQLYMSSQQEVLNIAKSVGFIIVSKINLVECQYDYQYIYILQKPT